MKTTLDLPADLLEEVKSVARMSGRNMKETVADLLRTGLLAGAATRGITRRATLTTDPATGLPLVKSPARAPISRMSSADFQTLAAKAQEEADIEAFRTLVRR